MVLRRTRPDQAEITYPDLSDPPASSPSQSLPMYVFPSHILSNHLSPSHPIPDKTLHFTSFDSPTTSPFPTVPTQGCATPQPHPPIQQEHPKLHSPSSSPLPLNLQFLEGIPSASSFVQCEVWERGGDISQCISSIGGGLLDLSLRAHRSVGEEEVHSSL